MMHCRQILTHLVQTTPDIDGRLLHNIVDDLWERDKEVGRVDLRVEEDLGCEETLISDIHRVFLCEMTGLASQQI